MGYDLDSAAAASPEEYAEAATPEFMPYRFKSRFYLIDLKKKVDFPALSGEIKRGRWQKPADVYADYQNARALMVASTLEVVRGLCGSPAGTRGRILYDYDAARTVPVIEPLGGVAVFMPLSNTIPPADRTNAFLVGGVLMDPSPRDGEELEKLLRTLEPYSVEEILITHHHRDHHERAPEIARTLGVGLAMSRDTADRIALKWGGDYFGGLVAAYAYRPDALDEVAETSTSTSGGELPRVRTAVDDGVLAQGVRQSRRRAAQPSPPK